MSDLISRKALIEWLTSHFDLELDEPLEKEMIRLINDQDAVQPQGIDKDRLIEFLNKESAKWSELLDNGWDEGIGGKLVIESVLDWINQQPQTGWIPCSERLPKKSGSYLVSGVWGSGKVAVGDCEFSVNDGYFDVAWNFDVIAWQPLPPAYKESK